MKSRWRTGSIHSDILMARVAEAAVITSFGFRRARVRLLPVRPCRLEWRRARGSTESCPTNHAPGHRPRSGEHFQSRAGVRLSRGRLADLQSDHDFARTRGTTG